MTHIAVTYHRTCSGKPLLNNADDCLRWQADSRQPAHVLFIGHPAVTIAVELAPGRIDPDSNPSERAEENVELVAVDEQVGAIVVGYLEGSDRLQVAPIVAHCARRHHAQREVLNEACVLVAGPIL
eukprot:913805-Prymnesium_polylepis.2